MSILVELPDWPANPVPGLLSDVALGRLSEYDDVGDLTGAWNGSLWDAVTATGAHRWSIPERLGGEPCARYPLLVRYGLLAEGSLTGTFLLSQQDAAARRLDLATSPAARAHADLWLRRLAAKEAKATVGISHLTTSQRLGAKALTAKARGDGGFVLDGAMPWVTGAEYADVIVAGARLDDGRQILVALPTDREGVEVDDAFPLAALEASFTAEVDCRRVEIEPHEVLVGPDPAVQATPGQVGTGGLETSALALGLARAALRGLIVLARERDDLAEPAAALSAAWLEAAQRLRETAEERPGAWNSAQVRGLCTGLVLRITQAYLTARKGSGFLRTDPAQRWARQALFFLVWSCPSPVAHQVIRDFSGLCDV
jgi:alkylation response protein AidB-like acyl-CoA dehydrogenase